MGYVDEEIAKIEQKKREKDRRKQQEIKKEQEKKQIPDKNEIKKMLQLGEVQIGEKAVSFQKVCILNKRFQVDLPTAKEEIKADTAAVYQMLDTMLGVSFQFYLSEEKKEEWESLDIYKERLIKNMKPSGINFQWLEEGEIQIQENTAYYLEFINPTGLGNVHNLMLFFRTFYGQLLCNFNYEDQDRYFWQPVLKVLIQQIKMIEKESKI